MKLAARLIWFFVLLLLCNTRSVLSQQLNFSLVPPPAEAPQWGLVTGITQDKSGLMWFTTSNGVQRYDGYKVVNYLNEPHNPNSLASNSTECIYADSAGIIWIGTRSAGLDRFDPVTGKFTHYRHVPNDPASIIDDNIRAIFEDHEGILWIGTLTGGLDRFDPKTGKFKHYQSHANDITSLSNDQVKVIYEDRAGTLWIGTGEVWGAQTIPGGGGLNRFDRKTEKFTRYMHDPKNPQSLVDNRVRAICEDSHGNFWVGTAGDGLHLMDRARGTFQRLAYDPKHPEKLSRPALNLSPGPGADDHITFIREDAIGSIWIGTMGAGIIRYDPNSQKIVPYGGNDSTGGLKDYHTWWSYMSQDGIIWISTVENNLYRVDPSQTIIPHVNTVVSHFTFYQEDPHILWEGTGAGLVRNDLSTGTKKIFKHDSLISSSISGDFIYGIVSDRQGGLWIGTQGSGLNHYNPGSQVFLHFRHNVKDNRSLDHDNIDAILVDHSNNLWVGTDSGLNMLNNKTGYFTHYHNSPSDSNSLSSSLFVSALFEDDDQNYLWVGTGAGGINRLNRKLGKFEHYIPSSFINAIIKDHEGIIWVASSDGLFKYNRKNNTFEKYVDPNGSIKITDAYGIAEDRESNLWLSGSNGILQINKKRDQILVFKKTNGIKNFYFFNGAPFKDLNDKLYFATYPNNYYSFSPDSLSKKIAIPLILMEDFKLGYESVQAGKGSPLSVPINETKEITLSHDQNVFSFDFVPINYSSPEDNRIVFKLENYDQDWRKPGAEKNVQYFNVPPGRYTFRVKASTNMGAFTEREIMVNITPPWWQTWWAYCIYGLLFVALIYSIDRFQKERLIKAERERTRERELAQSKEIEKAYHELKTTQTQLIQSEKMASLGELTAGIAHEIQNPLNFVNNFSEVNTELIGEMQDELKTGKIDNAIAISNNIKENEQKINHHGKRADAIVKGMLQHSQSNSGVKELTDINKLTDEYLRLSYHGLRAKDKSFNATLKTDFDESIGNINIIPQDIGRVILNLITNAFYAVDEKRKSGIENFEPVVSVSTKKTNDKVEIKVSDNGNGIPQKIIDKIFQPFFTTKPTGQGTGLGLSLSYDIVKAHGGEIKVETKEGEGTTFIIQIPANN